MSTINPRLRRLGDRLVGPGHPVYVIGEIGINHNGDLANALALIDHAKAAGMDAVKFQKRTPELAVPQDRWSVMRKTPWGMEMRTIDYRRRMEFDADDYAEIAKLCGELGIEWFASAWDYPALLFLVERGCKRIKVPSARNRDLPFLRECASTGLPVIMSCGMATLEQIDVAVEVVGTERLTLLHTVSAYPMPNDAANLRMMQTLRERYGVATGWSGHEAGLQISVAAAALGACMIERHVTVDHTLPGSDHASAVEPDGLRLLVRDVRAVESAMGDGVKTIHPLERESMARL